MTKKTISMDGIEKPVEFTEFNLNEMVENASIVIIAKRGSGKSWVCKALIQEFQRRNIPAGIVVSPTDKMNRFYADFFAESYIHQGYSDKVFSRILERQEIMIDKEKSGKKVDPRIFVIMDDCLGEKGKWLKKEPILNLLYNGRHYKITYILTMQYALGIGPDLRGNFDYIFLLADDFYNNQRRMHDHYAGMFPDLNTFKGVFTQMTNDNGCMVLINRGIRKTLYDKVMWFKAPDLSDTVIDFGCQQFKKFHQDNFDPQWSKKKISIDFIEYAAKKKKEKGVVKIKKVSKEEKARHLQL